MMVLDEELERAWLAVGRFIWAFAIIETYVDQILETLFSLNAAASLMLFPQLDLRKKLALIDLGLKRQKIDQSKLLAQVQKLHDVRNIIVHSTFGPDIDQDGSEGIDFDYISKKGKLSLPDWLTHGGPKRSDELWNTIITYTQFDKLNTEARELWDSLAKIGGSCAPIPEVESDDVENDLAADITQIVALPSNVIPFLRPGDRSDED